MKIGIYGGTFDPVHNGHLILARDAVETLGLDQLLFVPNRRSPHKPGAEPAPAAVRLEMLAAAIRGEERFAVDDWELRQPAPSYSVEFVEHLRRQRPGAELFYCVGADNLPLLHTWRRYDDLREMVGFVVLGRGGDPVSHPFRQIGRRLDFSASEVRERIANGRSARYLVPDMVLEIIARETLYRRPDA